MKYRSVLNGLGKILAFSATFYLFPVAVSLIYKEYAALPGFLTACGASALPGGVMLFFSRGARKIRHREALVIVGLCWLLISLFGALPAVIGGYIPSFADSFFETASGFTTTGATILTDFDLPKSIHFWRAFTHWLGGMGILVFMLAVLPTRGGDGFQLMKFESPGPQAGKLVSKIRRTAMILYLLYFVLTIAEFVFLICGGIPVYDSVILSMSTAGTGGFTSTAASVAEYGSVYADIVITVFMFIFSVNFSLYYLLLIGNVKSVLKDEELRFYVLFILSCILIITLDNTFRVAEYGKNFFTALHYSSFTVISTSSTTGFVITDYGQWSNLSQCLIMLVMIVGSMAGSTGGGLKASRVLILLKSSCRDTAKFLRPNAVYTMKMNGKPLSESVVSEVKNFFFVAVALAIISCLVLSFDAACDFTTSVTAFLTCFNNVGPGLSKLIPPTGSFAALSAFSKVYLSLVMLIGRLEIFPVFLLLVPKTWEKRY